MKYLNRFKVDKNKPELDMQIKETGRNMMNKQYEKYHDLF